MIRINLLKAHEIKKSKGQNLFLQWILCAYLGLILVLLAGYWVLGRQVENLKKEKIALENQTRVFAALQKELKTLKDKKVISQKRLSLLSTLEKDRHGPVRLMDTLSRILPVTQLWLTALKETGPEIRIEGLSLSNETLAEFMKRLETSGLFKQVDLIQSIQGAYKNLKVKQFALSAWTAPPPEPKGEKK
jgi:type IV pilus assembly protein PilN